MDINIISILYIAYRLAPFIIVSFFSLSSIFNQDLKGIIYLCGLLITSACAILAGNLGKSHFIVKYGQEDVVYNSVARVCNILTLTKTGPLSLLPLSQVVIWYTFLYLGYIIHTYNLITQNYPLLIIFFLLAIYDAYWIVQNECATPTAVVFALLGGATGGYAWAYIIDSLHMTKLQYFNGLSNSETCSVPKKQSFKCVMKGRAEKRD